MPKVVIYTTSTCPFCKLAKSYFQKHDVKYEEKDVWSDTQGRQEMIDKSGQMGVPVIDIDGQIVIGFDETKLTELLHIT
jgi:glutaredoxin-like YruB-family protein